MKALFPLLVVLGLGGGLGAGHAQLTLVLLPVNDTYVNSEYPDASYGDDGTLFVHAGSNTKRTYLQFDLQGISAATITSGSLRLWYGQAGRAGTVMDLHHVGEDAWDESSLTWRTMPAYDLVPLAG